MCIRDRFVTIEALEDAAAEVKINHSLADGYVKALRELRDTYGLQDDISGFPLSIKKMNRLTDHNPAD